MKSVIAIACWLASAGLAAAAPWTAEKLDTGVIVSHSAAQSDPSGNYYLVIECIVPGKWSVWVESPFEWEDGASYAPEAPATFLIDGSSITNVKFAFDDRQLGEGIAAYPAGQEAAFEALVDAIAAARSPITMSYFDRSASFSPEGSSSAIRHLRDSCR